MTQNPKMRGKTEKRTAKLKTYERIRKQGKGRKINQGHRPQKALCWCTSGSDRKRAEAGLPASTGEKEWKNKNNVEKREWRNVQGKENQNNDKKKVKIVTWKGGEVLIRVKKLFRRESKE